MEPKPKIIKHTRPPKAGDAGTFVSFEQFGTWMNYYGLRVKRVRSDGVIVVEKMPAGDGSQAEKIQEGKGQE